MLPKPHFYFERWRWSPLYGMYVSNMGHFRDKDKKPIRPKVENGKGYLVVQLKYGREFAHRIVAAVWLPCEDMYHLTVDHKDHNKRNNTVWNLEWVTEKENTARAKEDLDKPLEVTNTDTEIQNVSIKIQAVSIKGKVLGGFASVQDAAIWLKYSTNNATDVPFEVLEKRIMCSTKSGKAYFSIIWKICNN